MVAVRLNSKHVIWIICHSKKHDEGLNILLNTYFSQSKVGCNYCVNILTI